MRSIIKERTGDPRSEKIHRSDRERQRQLTPNQYFVTRQKGTEPPFTSEYESTDALGTYHSVCCGQPLFRSEAKFDSATGWPSFTSPLDLAAVEKHANGSHGRIRTEVGCARCDAHLGHVFEDGPDPTGLRYCINSLALALNRDNK